MPHWSTTARRRSTAVAPDVVWSRAYADATAWPRWNPELAAAELRGPLALGAPAHVRFKTGLCLTFRVTEFEDGRLFTDEARLPLARIGHRHILEPIPGGGTLMTNTIYLTGPLAPLWARLVGRRAASALPASQAMIEQLALTPQTETA